MRKALLCAGILLAGILTVILAGCGAPCCEDNQPAPAGVPPRIAFASDRAGNLDIYSMAYNGTDVKRLTVSPDNELSPAWSPDHLRLTYQRYQGGHWVIWVMNADGTGKRQLSSGPEDTHPCWSQDGTRIAFSRGADAASGLYSVNSTTGSGLKQLTSGYDDSHPCWGPGNKIVFHRRPFLSQSGDLAIYNAVTRTVTKLPNTMDLTEPAWSNDGTKIACVAVPPGGSSPRVYVINANGYGRMKLTSAGDGDSSPCWSPNRATILFARSLAPQWDLFTVQVTTRAVTRLTTNAATDEHPAWAWPH